VLYPQQFSERRDACPLAVFNALYASSALNAHRRPKTPCTFDSINVNIKQRDNRIVAYLFADGYDTIDR